MGKFLILSIVTFVLLIIATIFSYSKYAKDKIRFGFYGVSALFYLLFVVFALLWTKESFVDYPEQVKFVYGIVIGFSLILLGILVTSLLVKVYKIKLGLYFIEAFILVSWLILTVFACLWAGKTYEAHSPAVAISSAICLCFFILTCILPFYIKPYGNLATYINIGLMFVFGLAFILLAVKQSRVMLNNEIGTSVQFIQYLMK